MRHYPKGRMRIRPVTGRPSFPAAPGFNGQPFPAAQGFNGQPFPAAGGFYNNADGGLEQTLPSNPTLGPGVTATDTSGEDDE